MINEFAKIYSRDLDRLKNEIAAFHQEDKLWKTIGDIKNPAGNLCLHLVGNLSTYIGKNMGNLDYVRNREAEFNLKHIPMIKLIELVGETKSTVLKTFEQMEKGSLEAIHPEEVLGYPMTNGFFLIHLAAHLSYHLGQINYLRRALA